MKSYHIRLSDSSCLLGQRSAACSRVEYGSPFTLVIYHILACSRAGVNVIVIAT